MSIPLYYRYNSRRSHQPAGWRVIRIKSAIADRPGKYTHFTGFLHWGPCDAAVLDCDFILFRGCANHAVIMMTDRGQWTGYIPVIEDAERSWFDDDAAVARMFKAI